MICRNCNSNIPNGSSVCPNCGQRLSSKNSAFKSAGGLGNASNISPSKNISSNMYSDSPSSKKVPEVRMNFGNRDSSFSNESKRPDSGVDMKNSSNMCSTPSNVSKPDSTFCDSLHKTNLDDSRSSNPATSTKIASSPKTSTPKNKGKTKIKIAVLVAIILCLAIGVAIVASLSGGDDYSSGLNNNHGYETPNYSSPYYESSSGGNSGNNTSSSKDETVAVEFLNVENVYNHSVCFKMNGKKYTGVINHEGKIFYYTDLDYVNWTSIGNGAGYITKNDENGKKQYILFNSKGEMTASSSSGAFDEVIGYGDGLVLVYKDNSNISVSEHCYGVLNAEGKWEKPLIAGEQLPNEFGGLDWTLFTYIGEGIFFSTTYMANNNYCIMYNSKTGKAFVLKATQTYSWCKFKNGLLYVIGHKYSRAEIYPYKGDAFRSGDDYKPFEGCVAIDTDGNIVKEASAKYAFGSLLVNTSGEYIQILDTETNVTSEYKNYKSAFVLGIQFYGDNGIVTIKGADEKRYFTVIDKKGKQRFDPIVSNGGTKHECIFENRIIYKGSTGMVEMIDLDGNVILSPSAGYSFGLNCEYYDGMIHVEKTKDKGIYLNMDGEVINITMKKDAIKG